MRIAPGKWCDANVVYIAVTVVQRGFQMRLISLKERLIAAESPIPKVLSAVLSAQIKQSNELRGVMLLIMSFQLLFSC
jgi:hypothetical protein